MYVILVGNSNALRWVGLTQLNLTVLNPIQPGRAGLRPTQQVMLGYQYGGHSMTTKAFLVIFMNFSHFIFYMIFYKNYHLVSR